jgi:hypothetical protein
MEMDWLVQTEALIRVLESGIALRPARFSHRQFLSLVRFVNPESAEGRNLDELALQIATDRESFAHFLMEIPEPSRIRVFEQFARDAAPFFPVQVRHLLLELEQADESLEIYKPEGDTEKLNRYLKRIDGAILAGRYTLAFNLTNRLLMEYYRAFLYARMSSSYSHSLADLRLMSVSVTRQIVQYLRSHTIPFSERRILLITTVTNVLATMAVNLQESAGKWSIDKAIAIYARNNVKRIVRFLSKMM